MCRGCRPRRPQPRVLRVRTAGAFGSLRPGRPLNASARLARIVCRAWSEAAIDGARRRPDSGMRPTSWPSQQARRGGSSRGLHPSCSMPRERRDRCRTRPASQLRCRAWPRVIETLVLLIRRRAACRSALPVLECVPFCFQDGTCPIDGAPAEPSIARTAFRGVDDIARHCP